MKYKTLETIREIRMWLTHIVGPITAVILLSNKETKEKIKTYYYNHKRGL